MWEFDSFLNKNSPKRVLINHSTPHKNMTVCVGCLADNGKGIVLAADNKTTHTLGLGVEYEDKNTDHRKIVRFPNNIFVLGAGGSAGEEIISKSDIGETDTIISASEKIKKSYEIHLRGMIFTLILSPIGFTDWNDFFARQNQLHPTLVADIIQRANDSRIDNAFIIAGYDDKTKNASIKCLHPDRNIYSYDEFGFSSIGIGAPVVQFSLIKSCYKKSLSLEKVKEMVTEAMQDASHVNGVGELGELISLPSPI